MNSKNCRQNLQLFILCAVDIFQDQIIANFRDVILGFVLKIRRRSITFWTN